MKSAARNREDLHKLTERKNKWHTEFNASCDDLEEKIQEVGGAVDSVISFTKNHRRNEIME